MRYVNLGIVSPLRVSRGEANKQFVVHRVILYQIHCDDKSNTFFSVPMDEPRFHVTLHNRSIHGLCSITI